MNMNTFTTKHSILALMLLLLSQGVYAQSKEGNNWLFGAGGGMTWNQTQTIINGGKTLTGLPTPLTGSAMLAQQEGVYSMSDVNGNLLFYSDGMTIWNKDHQVMQNGTGMYGDVSSAQSGIVIPYPEQPDKYIVISIGLNNGWDRLAYSIVDMSLNGGLGAVTSDKNIFLTGAKGRLGECVSAIRHSNGVDFWIAAIGKGDGENSSFNVWKVTQTGVNTTCVGSYPMATNTNATAVANGYLRFSSNGKYFAWAENRGVNNVRDLLHFGQFDPSIGTASNIKVMNVGYNTYCVEFSPSNEIMYIGNSSSSGILHSYRFADLLTADNPPSGVTRQSRTTPTVSALQLGSDGRIYGAMNESPDMVVIDNPDSFTGSTLHVLSGLMAGLGRSGLPNFLPHIFAPTPAEGIIGSDQIIYRNSVPDQLESTLDASCSDGNISETITYEWEHSTDSLTWTPAPTPNNLSTYQPPTLTTTTYYRRAATAPTCGTVYSNVLKITVADDMNAGAIGSNQSINHSATPTALTSTTAATGGIGTITYQWESSTDGITWTEISGETGLGYQPPTLTTTTYYRRAASDDNYTVYSNSVKITVEATSSMITISAAGTEICSGDQTNLSATASSVTNPIFRWYSAATGGSPLATAPTFTPSPNLTVTTTFHVSVSGDGLAESSRKAVTVTVTPRSSSSMIKVQ